jgi:hypothetical protein
MYYLGRGTGVNRARGCELLHAAVEQGYQEAVGLYRRACKLYIKSVF